LRDGVQTNRARHLHTTGCADLTGHQEAAIYDLDTEDRHHKDRHARHTKACVPTSVDSAGVGTCSVWKKACATAEKHKEKSRFWTL